VVAFKNLLAQIRAVATEKPAAGLVQVAFHQALTDAVFAQQGKARLRVAPAARVV